MVAEEPLPELAYYYGDFIWDPELIDWVKALLLFFDGIALALPSHTVDRFIDSDPILARPLADDGLLVNFEPSLWLDSVPANEPETAALKAMIEHIDEHGTRGLDALIHRRGRKWSLLRQLLNQWSRVREAARGEGMDEATNIAALQGAITARLLQANIANASIQPVIDNELAAGFVRSVAPPGPLAEGYVIQADMRAIGVSLRAVALDEVLDFREQHGVEYRSYARDVRKFTVLAAHLTPEQRAILVRDRAEELKDRAEALDRLSRRAFGRPAVALLLGLVSAVRSIAGDPLGAGLDAGTAVALYDSGDPIPSLAPFSYILAARRELARKSDR